MSSGEHNSVIHAGATEQPNDPAAQFVTKFTSHYRSCASLARRFTGDNPELKDSAAISQLCRASQEMLDQAKAARALTEIYLALDEHHRDLVRPIIIERFKDITRSARASWLRFCDSMKLGQMTNPEIFSVQREFQPEAEKFQEALRTFIAMSVGTR